MNIRIERLRKELVEDYISFFDTTPHDSLNDKDKCYCVGFVSVDHTDNKTDFSSPEKRRELAKKYIISGKLDGYLAYEDDKVIGWCNSNNKEKCLYCGGFTYVLKDAFEVDCQKIKSIFCFVIAPEKQHQGVASELLKRVISDSEEEGYDIVESYPNKNFISVQYDFMGPILMYTKYGFEIVKEMSNDKLLMRKRINLK